MDLSEALGTRAGALKNMLGNQTIGIIDIATVLAETLPKLRDHIADTSDTWSTYEAVLNGIANEDIEEAFTCARHMF